MRKLLTEHDVTAAKKNKNSQIIVDEGCVITPAALDAAKYHQIKIVSRSSIQISPGANQINSETRKPSKIVLGADHGGFELKGVLIKLLEDTGYATEDVGTYSKSSVDYPDYAHAVAKRVSENLTSVGIIIDGAGVGSAMAANKVPGIRAAACYDVRVAMNSREHNFANVLTLGSGITDSQTAKEITKVWLETSYGAERHERRVNKIMKIESDYRS